MENMSCDPSGDLGQGGLVSVDEILTLNPADFLNTLPDISSESSSGVLSDAMATVTPLEDVSMATPPSDITMTSDNVTSGDITMTSQSPDVSMETQMSTITDMSLEPAMVSLLSHISDTSSTCVAMTTSDMPPTCVAMATSESSSVNVSASIAAGPSESSVTIDASTKSPTASDVSDSTTRGDMSVSTPITLTASLETGEDTKSLITGATPVIKVDPPFVTDAAEDGAALPSDTDKSVSSDAALNTLSDSVVSSQSVSSADTVKAPVSVVDTTTDNVVTSDVSHLVDTNPVLDDTTAGETTSPTGETTSLTSQTTSPTGETTSPTSQTTSPIGETTSPTGETTSPTGETTSPAGEATGVTNEAEASVWKTTTTQSETIGKSETTTTDCTITPAAHETITAECESAPAEWKSATAECESVSAECESAPAECESAPAECESVAAERETSTTDSVATPAECESAPAKCETTPAGCETTPADSETMPAESETTPAESEIITAKCDIAADKCETTPDKCETTPDKCETIPDKCEINTDKSESTSDKCETTTATSANPPEDETVKKGDETSGVNIPESTSTPVDIAVGDSLAVRHSGSISAVTDGSSVPVMPGGSTEVTAAIASSITTVSLSTPVSPRDVLSPGRAAVAADGSIITLSSNFSLPVSFGAAGTVTTTQSHLPPGVAPVMFPTSLPGGSTSGMSQQFAGAINLTITNGSVSVKPKHDSAPPAATPPVATPTAAPLPTAIRYTNLGMPTLISTMPSSMKLPPNLCLAAPRATTSLSGQLPISSTFVNGTTMMIRPAPPAARFSNQMALVQSAGTKMRAPFITPGTVLPPGAKLLAHVPAQFVPMVTSMPRGKAPSGGVLTSTSATVATSLTDATLWMASMQPVLPAGTAGSETLATSNKSTVGVSSAPPGGNVVTSTLVTEGAMKQPTIRSRTDAELSASSPDKVTERKDSATEGSSDFDPVSAMEWKDGVGNLPGSDLKFKLNEFGVIEMVTEEDEMDTKVSMEAHDGDGSHQGTDMTDAQEMAADTNGICRCENCGVYGMISEFCNGGRFCSKSCVGSFASKKCMMKHVKSSHDREKKKKRKLSLPEDHRELKVVKVAPDKDDLNGNTTKIIITHVPKKTRGFHWAQYLDQENAVATPVKMFKDAFPCTKNGFKVGMKLEGIDPRHPQLYTVLSVAEVKGFRLRLHFDGYSECYDFWVSANNPFLFPAGWAEKNGKTLQPPKGYTTETFNWATYLKSSRFPAAPKHLFTNTQAASVTPHGFRVGMKLEAVDKKHTYLTCVATVADVLGDRILIHFDGWEDNYDYWCDPSSPYIHPMGWCQESGKPLSPPNDWKDIDGFTWEDYLARTNTQAVAARAFKMRPANQFEVGMKLEAVDQRNPLLVRVATVSDTETHRLKIHFDGWSAAYDYWVDDDSPDIHPVGWCSKTMHPLTPTVSGTESSSQSGCPTPGCSGVGHVKGAKYTGHHSSFGCPYSAANMNKEMILQDRVGPTRSDSFDGSSLNVAPSPERIFRKCPTHGCDGSGHVTGKYTAHHRQSGCPLVDKYIPPSVPAKSAPTTPLALLNGGKPLFGPGSGRGRKKTKLLKLIQKEKELQAQGKVSSHNYRDSSHVIKKEESQSDVDAECVLRESIHQSVFMSSMLPSPSKDLPLCWEQHSKLLPGVDQHCAADVTEWSTEKVAGFIGTLPGCEELADVFQEEQIDGEAFLLLTQTDIVKIMNIKLGPALKIYNSILIFKNNDNTV